MKDLTKYNYEDLVEKITDLMKDKEGWGDGYQSSTGQTLIQLLADVSDNLHYLLERRTVESFMHHARIDTSVIARASELGYRPYRASSHSGVLSLKIKDPTGQEVGPIFELFVPKYTKFQFEDRIFHSTESVMMRNTDVEIEIPIREGDYVEKTFQLSQLNSMNEIVVEEWREIDEYTLVVSVGGEEWTDVREDKDVNKRALAFLGKDDKMYDIKYSTDGMSIVFGDDWFGKKPDGEIKVSYIKVPTESEIYTLGRNFVHPGGFKDNQDPTISYDTDIKNTVIIAGGRGIESVDSIRKNATIYNQTNGRGVTNTDYEFWTRKSGIGSIKDVSAYGEEEIDTYVYNANNVYITYATDDGLPLALKDKINLRNYLNNVKTTQAHLVISPATTYKLIANASVRKYDNVPTADSHTYYLIREFIKKTFGIKDGSVGKTYHNSDIINDFYSLKYNDLGVTKPLVDFVKWDMKIGIPYNFPSPVRSAMVGISPKRFESLEDDTEWVIIVDGIGCRVVVNKDDTPSSLLLIMRDVIRKLTDIEVETILEGAAMDDEGNLVPIEIDPEIGYHLLIGRESSNRNINDIIVPPKIGNVITAPRIYSENFEVDHYYYSPQAGDRPIIPMRPTTEVEYLSPSDVEVEVWIKESYEGEGEFTLYKKLEKGELFKESFNKRQLLKFKLLEDSNEDGKVTIRYSDWEGARIGLRLKHINMQSFFTVNKDTGDYRDDSFVNYHVVATRPPERIQNGQNIIHPTSVRILDEDGNVVAVDLGDGTFDIGGSIDYITGVISPPISTQDEKDYMVTYKQDKYDNISLGKGDVLTLSEIPEEIDGEVVYSSVEIV